MTVVGSTVIVWTGVRGIPENFVWSNVQYRVTDTPTSLDVDYAAITHPGVMPLGWRFQGTSDDGDSRIFDVLYDATRDEWQLLHTYQ